MKPLTAEFRRLSDAALENRFLRQAIATANRSFQSARTEAIDSVPDWEELRRRGHAAKREALEDLAGSLTRFEKAFTKRGGLVHWAETAVEACEIIGRLIDSASGRRVIKSKSMVTEEIGLNAFLEARGCDVVESDLGEYIVQLAEETPSHIITPAIHKSRGEIAQLLSEKIGSAPDADIPAMTAAARAALRERFLDADVGISGANFAVAETGTIVIVENEGNARLATTLPRMHIAVIGIEKVLPRRRDLAVLLRLLCRSATGQKITSYVSMIGGPRAPRPSDRQQERDGPEEVHVVFLDAGRSRVWADPKSREALLCIRCGACLNFCPVYERIGGHSYGWVYPGPIGSVITPHYVGQREAGDLPQASSLCGRCAEVCPVKIPLPDLLLSNRARAVELGSATWSERLSMRLQAWLFASPRAWRIALFVGRPLYRLARRTGVLRWLPGPARIWSRARDFPESGGPRFRARWKSADGWRGEDERA